MVVHTLVPLGVLASMKVPPKRKGNGSTRAVANRGHVCLNESPSEKEGKFRRGDLYYESLKASMKVPPKRKGNCSLLNGSTAQAAASMKVPPKRKGNFRGEFRGVLRIVRLNESPSEKEGKFECVVLDGEADGASMKVPPKRKGNILAVIANAANTRSLNESPSEKEGKSLDEGVRQIGVSGLNESPSEKEGK